jgi:hypothetical protein
MTIELNPQSLLKELEIIGHTEPYEQEGAEIFAAFNIDMSLLSKNLTGNDAGFCQTYFITYLQLLHMTDQNFLRAASQPNVDAKALKHDFLKLIEEIPAALLQYLFEKKENRQFYSQKDKTPDQAYLSILPTLLANLSLINLQLPDEIKKVFDAEEDKIKSAFLANLSAVDTESEKFSGEMARSIHRWIEEKDSRFDEYIRHFASRLNENKSAEQTTVVPLDEAELGTIVFAKKSMSFIPAFLTKAREMPSLLLLIELLDKAKELNQKNLEQKIVEFFYKNPFGLQESIKKFTQIIEDANILIFSIQQLLNNKTLVKKTKGSQ